ncbi:hypothetical protein [Methylococcus capsulatus]|jgi:hypothetical protein|uniref:hypothetical protein n=1 Tax=Methylococcus capsulatus TaxID=414 RepID=UPI0002E2EBC3|nr:hypothetical protein [Methylococcus capsulatus]QXP89870.1 hypothetical protein KW114_12410 [Methylococcus capsulatus]
MMAWLLGTGIAAAGAEDSYATTKKLPPLHHVTGVVLPEEMKTPKRLPLREDRELRCPTCHGVEDIDRVPFRLIDRSLPDFLRGGPYDELDAFCYQCHEENRFKRPNVHIMLDKSGKLQEEHCTYCHEEVHRERDRPLRAPDYKLRLPPENLCYGCHLKTPHFNALEHQESKPDARMKLHMKDSKERYGIILPLSREGKVMCPTCHAPHQPGVIDALNPAAGRVDDADLETGVSYREHPWDAVVREDKKARLETLSEQSGRRFELGYRRIDKEVLLRLPAKNGELCLACHQFDE